MKAPTVKSVLAAFKANQQSVQVELRPDGTTAFIPVMPMAASTSHDPVMEALRHAS
jgi:hypothetical protein